MHTEDVNSLISDSGITSYRITAKVWDVYTIDNFDQWHFPEGFYFEQFDTLFQVNATGQSDTAFHYDKEKLWRFVGNVRVMNVKGERFSSPELFWNEKEKKFYSDSLVHIIEADGSVKNVIGFVSNQEMTVYSYRKMHNSNFFLSQSSTESDSLQLSDEQRLKQTE